MGTDDKPEACGRCSMTSVIGMAAESRDDPNERDPFDGDRIELDEDELRSASPHVVAFGRLKDQLDRWATAITYGR